MKLILTTILSLTIGFNCIAQSYNNKSINALKNETEKSIESGYDAYKKIALNIWDYAELGFKENKSWACRNFRSKSNRSFIGLYW